MPHLVPQKTNVLTGAATKYFSNQTNQWKQDYNDLLSFQRMRMKAEQESTKKKAGLQTSLAMNRGRGRVDPLTGNPIEEAETKTQKFSLPLRGKGVPIVEKLTEIHERKDRIELMNLHQREVNRHESIQMLEEEQRFVTEANNAVKLTSEIALWQKATKL